MTGEDIARLLVYSFIGVPALLFVVLYLAHWAGMRKTTESYHLLIFTGAIGFVVFDLLGYTIFGLWDFSLWRFLASLAVVGALLWQRLYLLLKNLVIPRARARTARRREARETVH
jgi:hypothetical protein